MKILRKSIKLRKSASGGEGIRRCRRGFLSSPTSAKSDIENLKPKLRKSGSENLSSKKDNLYRKTKESVYLQEAQRTFNDAANEVNVLKVDSSARYWTAKNSL
jgi:hypothetical protein